MYDKHSSQIIGFISLGDVNNQLLCFQRLTSNENSSLPLPVAKHVLVFMVRGIFQHLEFPYVQFPCDNLSSDMTFPLVWECAKLLEASGLKVYKYIYFMYMYLLHLYSTTGNGMYC